MFRIDKTLVSYDRSEYTNISTILRSSQKAPEEHMKEQLLEELESQLQNKTATAEQEAGVIIAVAQKNAEEILRAAEKQAADIAGKSEEKGYRDGKAKAEEETQKRLEKQTEALQTLILQAGAARDAMIDAMEDDIITLVIETAQKVINIELEKNDNTFMELIKNALGQMKREGKIIIRVSSEDYASLFSSGSTEFMIDNEHIKATVVEEPSFGKGDCIIDADGETANAGIRSQLKHIEFAFRNEESYVS